MTGCPPFVATYRLQLRNGVDLDQARDLLPWLSELGASHLYLSPLFHAASGSTHGYDVIDPNAVDPVLGGEAAFIALSDAARTAGIGLLLDIVPNHMAFTPENPFVADILRHGRDSRFARVFDIDWEMGPLHFPVLDGMVEDVLESGQIALVGTAQDPALAIYAEAYPLRPTPLARQLVEEGVLDASNLTALLSEQWWSVGDWRETADAIIHRRFFNITGLIGVLQEDPRVFKLTHRWIVNQVRAGRVQGLRVDHIDGLARPGDYLQRLREAVGTVPVWAEKIVKPGEDIPEAWPIEGMTGYEFMTPVTRLLTNGTGLAVMRDAAAVAVPANMQAEVRTVRRQLLGGALAPELRRVEAAASAAMSAPAETCIGVAEAVADLAVNWPVYRSYAADGCPLAPRFEALRAPGLPGILLDLLHGAENDTEKGGAARDFAGRFEQLTGALTAKSEEDTVFFRMIAYLPFCEVGAEPDLTTMTVGQFSRVMQERSSQWPLGLNTLSTHDTKRSADARAAVVALSHFPGLAARLLSAAGERAKSHDLPQRWGLYALQSALMLRGEPAASERLSAHLSKAMREAKDLSQHEAPDEEAESRLADLGRELLDAVAKGEGGEADEWSLFERLREQIVLAHVVLQLTAPGIPDIYQGCELLASNLTDPDNRRAVDFARLTQDESASSLSARKRNLTRRLLHLRRGYADLFTRGDYALIEEPGCWRIVRTIGSKVVVVEMPLPHGTSSGEWQISVFE